MRINRAVTTGVVTLAGLFCVGLVWLGSNRFMAEKRAMSYVEVGSPTGIPGVTSAAPAAFEPCSRADKPVPELVVHVVGAVNVPGVYHLPVGARVQEAVAAAGGATAAGRPHTLSLARHLMDGEKLFVPTEEQVAQPELTPAESQGATREVLQAGQSGPAQPKPVVRVNSASIAELDAVTYITPKVAAGIVAYRQDNGPFRSLDDLINVSGIGPATLDKIKPHLSL